MFLLNVGYDWSLSSSFDDLRGVVLLPAHNYMPRFSSRSFDHARLLFDPQLYLASLDSETCDLTCSRLSTYPWFNTNNLPNREDYDNARLWQNAIRDDIANIWPGRNPAGDEILESCEQCIGFQVDIGTTFIILPSPLIIEREDEAENQAIWLDSSIEAVDNLDVGLPVLATVALDESTINDQAFEPAGFLDTIVDQISAREQIDGVYIVISRTQFDHPFSGSVNLAKAYIHLCSSFNQAGMENTIVNFADLIGIVCSAFGATGFGIGQSRPLRQMSLQAYREGGGGRALPHLYSHRSVAEYLSETHLDEITQNRLLNRVRDDSPFSNPLIRALRRGESASDVASWAESLNNCGTANRHFIHRMMQVGSELYGYGSSDLRRDHVREWLEGAAANTLYIHSRLGREPEDEQLGRVAPTQNWLDIFDEYDQ